LDWRLYLGGKTTSTKPAADLLGNAAEAIDAVQTMQINACVVDELCSL